MHNTPSYTNEKLSKALTYGPALATRFFIKLSFRYFALFFLRIFSNSAILPLFMVQFVMGNSANDDSRYIGFPLTFSAHLVAY